MNGREYYFYRSNMSILWGNTKRWTNCFKWFEHDISKYTKM